MASSWGSPSAVHQSRAGNAASLSAGTSRLRPLASESASIGCSRGASPPVLAQPATSSAAAHAGNTKVRRSEEDTYELQSLMRISQAVSCVKKKTTIDNIYK